MLRRVVIRRFTTDWATNSISLQSERDGIAYNINLVIILILLIAWNKLSV